MKLTVNVEREGGTTSTVKVSPLAFIGWESKTGRKMSDLAAGGLGMGDLATLAMEQERLQGLEVPDTVNEWLVGVDDLDPIMAEPTPTDAAPSAAPSIELSLETGITVDDLERWGGTTSRPT